jgi:hypothetical protein
MTEFISFMATALSYGLTAIVGFCAGVVWAAWLLEIKARK